MAIDIGDAVLTFVGDTTQLDQTFARVGAEVSTNMQPAVDAFKGTTDAAKGLSDELAVGQNGAKKLGEVMNLAGGESRESMYEARGEMMLLDEMIGVRLPRHVVAFLAELPGVGVALSAAFQATAVIFIVEALVKVGEKINEFIHHAEKVGEAWEAVHQSEQSALDHLSNDLIKAQIETDKLTGDHLGALLLELQLIDRTTLSNLRNEFIKLEKEADKAFAGMDANLFESLLGGQEGSGEAKAVFDRMAKSVNDALATGKAESFLAALNAINEAADTADKRLKTATLPADQLEAWAEINKRADAYRDLLEKTASLDWQEKLNDALRLVAEHEADLEKQAKRTMEARIEQAKATENAEHNAFNDGKISAEQWAQAQIKATDDIAKAHVDYANSLAAIAQSQKEISDQLKDGTINAQKWADAQKQSAETSKSAAAAQDAQNEKLKEWNAIAKTAADGLTKAQSDTAKLRSEMEKLVFPAEKAHQQAQAFKELEAAENRLAQAQKTLALAESSADFKEQEAAIKELSNLRIISKQREAALLAQLNQREGQDELRILRNQLGDEERALNLAKTNFQAASKDALFPDDQLAILKTKLDQAQAAWDKTQTEIVKQQSSSNDRVLSLDRSFYNQVLALATATGNRLLAEKLKENHAALASAQADLVAAKSKGALTQATNLEIKALEHLIATLKKEETQLENNAKKGLGAWKQFGEGFRDDAQHNQKTMEEMGQEMRQDLQDFAADLGAEFAAMLQGQESFGAAMAHATEKLIGKMAQQWGEYYAAKAIADIFWNPALGGAEFAAAAALFTVGSLLGSLGGAGGGSKGSSASTSTGTGSAAPAAGSTAVSAGAQPTQTVNVQHLASGGLVTQETLAVIGDSAAGGRSREAVIPLDNPEATAAIAKALGAHMQGGGFGDVRITIESDIPHVIRKINGLTTTGRARLTASNSLRLTDRSKK